MANDKPPRSPSPEDRELWRQVTRHDTPLNPGQHLSQEQMRDSPPPIITPSPPTEQVLNTTSHTLKPSASPPSPPAPALNRRRKRLLARKQDIDGRLDLHDMTQPQAHAALDRFLQHAYLQGLRRILVITGKGTAGEGILRRVVPLWLEEPEFSSIVSGIDIAPPSMGGNGALILHLRRNTNQ